MENSICTEEYLCLLTEKKYEVFCKSFHDKINGISNLTIFQDVEACKLLKELCAEIFDVEIRRLKSLINEPCIGIAALDIPEASIFDKKVDSICGVAAGIGIFSNIAKPSLDILNKMPFSIFSASHENAKLLESKGHTQYPPEVKLGFHNDGLFSDNEISIPLHLMVYNMYINYHLPGNFKWVPEAAWEESDKFAKILKEKQVKIRITPNFYFDKNGEIKNTLVDMVEVPICQVDEMGGKMFFLNGNIMPEENDAEIIELVKSMRESISKNPVKILIPQKERRALFLKNIYGFHARDIFEQPIEGADLTRVFIRSVDLNAKRYSSY